MIKVNKIYNNIVESHIKEIVFDVLATQLSSKDRKFVAYRMCSTFGVIDVAKFVDLCNDKNCKGCTEYSATVDTVITEIINNN